MAASSTDFQWYNDIDDEHPIGQGPPTNTSTANTSPSVTASAGPSDRV
jgi:hypothetical protein